jgi:hypothetical protein
MMLLVPSRSKTFLPDRATPLDPTALEQLGQEGLDVAFLEAPDLHAAKRGEQVKPPGRVVSLDGARLHARGDECQRTRTPG